MCRTSPRADLAFGSGRQSTARSASQPRRPSGSTTPIHDHLSWGLVAIGEPDEEFYAPGTARSASRAGGRSHPAITTLLPRRRRPPRPDDPGRDLGVDPLPRERHRLHRPPHLRRAQALQAFRSGYANAVCEPERPTPVYAACAALSSSARRDYPCASVAAWSEDSGCSSFHFQFRSSIVPGRPIGPRCRGRADLAG